MTISSCNNLFSELSQHFVPATFYFRQKYFLLLFFYVTMTTVFFALYISHFYIFHLLEFGYS